MLADANAAPAAATAVVGDLKLLVPLEGLVDLGAERMRLDKEIKRVEIEIAKCDGKLASDTFVQNAPAAVVEQERKRLLDWNAQREALASQRAKLDERLPASINRLSGRARPLRRSVRRLAAVAGSVPRQIERVARAQGCRPRIAVRCGSPRPATGHGPACGCGAPCG